MNTNQGGGFRNFVLPMLIVSLVYLALLFLTGCTTTGGTFCDLAKPIRHSQAVIDAESDAEVDADLAHNLKGAKLCGWKP